ncbi:uncharacterized protein LOC106645289 [Copidosoma floridanum]|uniref:uncharacterized protein LOC106645289 n=1 Tax=Copidosoma floridanum TaxID=29053 RepID=UPI0006C96D75|nr:uncharacterized protein LOC106645289 [Copidosoma floridanum]
MPKKCSVPQCKNIVKFKFPKNVCTRLKWLTAIGREAFVPKANDGICINHFSPESIITESYRGGYKLTNIQLKRGTVPTIIDLKSSTKDSGGCDISDKSVIYNDTHLQDKSCTKDVVFPALLDDRECRDNTNATTTDVKVYKKEIDENSTYEIFEENDYKISNDQIHDEENFIVKVNKPRYNIDDFRDPSTSKSFLHFCGLENHEKFMNVFYSLQPALFNLKLEPHSVHGLSERNQLFLVLWKLRLYAADIELANHFNISEQSVQKIFISWILFMSKTWRMIGTWPSQQMIDFYMPETFKKNVPKVRVTLDATEIKTEAPSQPIHKQSSLITYKNANTFKIIGGTTPGGMISHSSSACSGSTDDQQTVDRMRIIDKFKKKDEILPNKRIVVRDIFAPYGVKILTPIPLVSVPHEKVGISIGYFRLWMI